MGPALLGPPPLLRVLLFVRAPSSHAEGSRFRSRPVEAASCCAAQSSLVSDRLLSALAARAPSPRPRDPEPTTRGRTCAITFAPLRRTIAVPPLSCARLRRTRTPAERPHAHVRAERRNAVGVLPGVVRVSRCSAPVPAFWRKHASDGTRVRVLTASRSVSPGTCCTAADPCLEAALGCSLMRAPAHSHAVFRPSLGTDQAGHLM